MSWGKIQHAAHKIALGWCSHVWGICKQTAFTQEPEQSVGCLENELAFSKNECKEMPNYCYAPSVKDIYYALTEKVDSLDKVPQTDQSD